MKYVFWLAGNLPAYSQKYLSLLLVSWPENVSRSRQKYVFLLPPSLLGMSQCIFRYMCFGCLWHGGKCFQHMVKNICFCCSYHGWKRSQHKKTKTPAGWNSGHSLDNRLIHLLTWRSAHIKRNIIVTFIVEMFTWYAWIVKVCEWFIQLSVP